MPIDPGATLGILGGGQLGRMLAMAARPLGYHVQVLDPDPSCPARPLADACITAAFDDVAAATLLAERCAVVTLEIEKIGLAALEAVAARVPMRPGPGVLAVVQDRGRQKDWLARHGFPAARWRLAASATELDRTVRELGGDCFAKATSGGYDGRGQAELRPGDDAASAWSRLGGGPCVVEEKVDIAYELSVLVARRPSGAAVVYPPAQNHHERRVLAWSVLPAPVPVDQAQAAAELGRQIAEALGVEGLLVIEIFARPSGELLVNELAPRPHNSYHASSAACVTSQFEQAVRAVCDLPLGSAEITRPAAIYNLLGDLWRGGRPPPFAAALAQPGVTLHLYGKAEARPGRKMGHLLASAPSSEEAVARVQAAYAALL